MDRLFGALSDPTRRGVVEMLVRGPCPVSDLAKPFRMALSSFLQHLDVLKRVGLVRSKKVGRVRTVELVPDRLQFAEAWLSEQRKMWNQRLNQLDAFLQTQKHSGGKDTK
jgi:DNA-binding transcriptional ArsR family regulator